MFINYPIYLIGLMPLALISGPFISEMFLVILSINFLYISIKEKLFFYYKNYFTYIFLFFCFYLIFTSIFATEILISLKSSFFYLRFRLSLQHQMLCLEFHAYLPLPKQLHMLRLQKTIY